MDHLSEQSLGQASFSRCRFFLGFPGDASDQRYPWLLSQDQASEKYCRYFPERVSETMSGNGPIWARKEFRGRVDGMRFRFGKI